MKSRNAVFPRDSPSSISGGRIRSPRNSSYSNANHDLPTKHEKRYFQKQQRRHQIYLMTILVTLVLVASGLLAYVTFAANHKNKDIRSHLLSETSRKKPSRLRDSRRQNENGKESSANDSALFEALDSLENSMLRNSVSEYILNKDLAVPLDSKAPDNLLLTRPQPKVFSPKMSMHGQFFRVSRRSKRMDWQDEWEKKSGKPATLVMDYTQPDLYDYPELVLEPPSSTYPPLRLLRDIFDAWPQDEIDSPPLPIREVLQNFDYTNSTQMEAATIFRQRKLPFKLTNVPELLQANEKWTDDFVSSQFDAPHPSIQGKCQESPHHFFAFFQPASWNVEHMGLPPTRNNDYTFAQWAEHARYADAAQLSAQQPHYYWQAGVPPEEREVAKDQWSFVSLDLPSFSSPESTFISPEPSEQKGIQCRFGERGVTTATHYDAGRNMVGMIHGAKRYILHPPRECHKLGIATSRASSLFRHSLLELGKVGKSKVLDNKSSVEERAWLNRASTSEALETVLKEGEVLFIPSHWFHYIIGLQKNAQCNVRSGVDLEGDDEFGSAGDISPEHCDARKL